MYPFGSGYPNQQQYYDPNNMPPYGAGYPQQPQPQMPQFQSFPPYGAGYPPQQPQPQMQSYPTNSPYPTQSYYPSQQQQQFAPHPTYSEQIPQPTNPYGQTYTMPSSASYLTQTFSQYPTHNANNSHSANTSAFGSAGPSKGRPSVTAFQSFNAVEDAKALRKAMKGFGTDEKTIINVLCRRTNQQRMEILKAYKTNFGKDLVEDLKSETSGNFENCLVALMTPIVDFYAKELHDAISGIGTDEDALIEVLCGLSNYEINVIKDAYRRNYQSSLESDLMSDTSGNFKRFLVSLCNACRDESGATNVESARNDATELLRAGELRIGTDESTFNMIFCQRNYEQLKLVFEEYKSICGHSIEIAIGKEFSGDIRDGLMAIVQIVSNKHEFYASRLHKSMAGIGTTDKQLIRLIVTRCEVDMLDIKDAFQRKYGDSLRNWIKGDTSGHYKNALYALIGEEKS